MFVVIWVLNTVLWVCCVIVLCLNVACLNLLWYFGGDLLIYYVVVDLGTL